MLRRVLSDHQVRHVVHVARERSPWVLRYAVTSCADLDLAELATRALTVKSESAVREEIAARTAGERTRHRHPEGLGVVELHADPDDRGVGGIGQRAVLDLPSELDPCRLGVATDLGEYLTARLGDNPAAWKLLGDLLTGPEDLLRDRSWGAVAESVVKAAPAAPKRALRLVPDQP